jgi:hypothetical protein
MKIRRRKLTLVIVAGGLAASAINFAWLCAIAQADSEPAAWVNQINFYRAIAHLPRISEDPKMSAADLNHARYIVKRFQNVSLATARGLLIFTRCGGRP